MLIGFAGQIEAGKTTAANLLCDHKEFSICSYATPLKAACVELTGLPMRYFTDKDLKSKPISWFGKSPRELMQLFGTEFIRDMIHPDFWVNRMKQKLTVGSTSLNITHGYNVAIDDVRFANEAKLIQDLGGKVVRIIRENYKSTAHISEEIDFPVDFIIDNNFSWGGLNDN